MEYTIYSSPTLNEDYSEKPIMEKPISDNPTLDTFLNGTLIFPVKQREWKGIKEELAGILFLPAEDMA